MSGDANGLGSLGRGLRAGHQMDECSAWLGGLPHFAGARDRFFGQRKKGQNAWAFQRLAASALIRRKSMNCSVNRTGPHTEIRQAGARNH